MLEKLLNGSNIEKASIITCIAASTGLSIAAVISILKVLEIEIPSLTDNSCAGISAHSMYSRAKIRSSFPR